MVVRGQQQQLHTAAVLLLSSRWMLQSSVDQGCCVTCSVGHHILLVHEGSILLHEASTLLVALNSLVNSCMRLLLGTCKLAGLTAPGGGTGQQQQCACRAQGGCCSAK